MVEPFILDFLMPYDFFKSYAKLILQILNRDTTFNKILKPWNFETLIKEIRIKNFKIF